MWVCSTIPALGQSITGAEYFFDSDPGVAMGTPITVTTGDQVDVTANISTTGLNPGFHNLIVRTKNSDGKWSLYESRGFYIKPASVSSTFQLKQAEYFFDDDPGVGNGTPVTAFTQADQISITQNISLSGLNPGFHTLMIRVKSDDKHWSLYESRNLYIKPPVASVNYKVAKAEYFFDTDPGLGKGTPCDAFTKDSAISLTQNVAVNSLSAGFKDRCTKVGIFT